MERCWGQFKKYMRSNCNYSFPSLKVIVPQALAVMFIDLSQKYFCKVRDYQKAITFKYIIEKMLIFHDKSTLQANDNEPMQWDDATMKKICCDLRAYQNIFVSQI